MLSHLISLLRAGQLRFRAETYGLYYPAEPDQRRWWQVAPSTVVELGRNLRRYRNWRRLMVYIAAGDAHEWWGRQWPAIDLDGELARSMQEDPS